MTTGDKIRGIRLLKELTQDNMADMLNITRTSYGDMERGTTKISDERLEQIAKVLGVTPADILSFGEKVSYFFDHSNGNFVNTGGSPTNIYNPTQQELEIEKLKLEIEKLKLEKERAEHEAKYRRDKNIS